MGWTKVNEHILKLPFCHFMQQIVPTVSYTCPINSQQIEPTVLDQYPINPFYEGCCYPCLNKEGGRGLAHKVTMNPPIEEIDETEKYREYKGFLKEFSRGWLVFSL